ncbi:hypothetical protein C3L33_14707, partial [Rhododendron williamsianum]
MSEREDVGRRLYEACLSGSVPALDALIEKDPLILDRVSSLTCFSNDTPLHVAVLHGHLDFTKALLARKPKLATELYSIRCSPLHLASAEGHVEIVQELLRVNTDVCIARDQDGSTIKFLLAINSVKDQVNVKNHNGSTALDVVEDCPNRDEKAMEIIKFLEQAAGVCDQSTPPSTLHLFWNKYFSVGSDWLREVRGHLITAATLTATMAYQAILSPPGGFWQESGKGATAGQAVMDSYHSELYAAYLLVNTAVLTSSLSTIMLALSGVHNKFLIWMLILTVYTSLSCMAGAYVMAVLIVFPEVWNYFHLPLEIFNGMLYSWMGICGIVLVLLAGNFILWLRYKSKKIGNFILWLRNKPKKIGNKLKEFRDYVKKCRTHREPGATNSVDGDRASTSDSRDNTTRKHKCIGNFC